MCDFPKCKLKGEYLLGVSKAKSKKAEKIIGSICIAHVRESIDKIMGQAFGTTFYVTIFDLNKNLLYHSFDADLEGYSAVAGWGLYVKEIANNHLILTLAASAR